MDTTFLQSTNRRRFYQECCDTCSGTEGCQAFQLNMLPDNATCELFSKFEATIPGASSSVAGVCGNCGGSV